MLAKALALLAVPLLVAADCTRTYTVQPNDICDSISRSQNVSTFQLWAVNYPNIDANCDNLTPGTTICLGWPGVDCTTNYVVQLGDTCDGVASQWGINTTILYANNPQLDQNYCDNLYVGEVVCTAPTVICPAPPANATVPGTTVPATATPAETDLPYCDEI